MLNRFNASILAAVLFTLLLIGCSSNETVTQPAQTEINGALQETGDANHLLWGMWSIDYDLEGMEFIIRPERNLQAHFNIADMVVPPACDDCLVIAVNAFDTVTRILDVDVTLYNPFPITGNDVRGILFTDNEGHLLTNPLGWTKYWDIPGGETLNPFKGFYTGPVPASFGPGEERTENYLVYIPVPPAYAAIKFAVDVSWPNITQEPYGISFFSHDPLYDFTGSQALAQISVFDWQDDVDGVTLVAPEITGENYTDFTHAAGPIWQVDIINNEAAPPGDYFVRIIATSEGSNDTALYQFVTITIEDGESGWAYSDGTAGADSGYRVVVDADDKIYTTGYYDNELAFLHRFDPDGVLEISLEWGGGLGSARGYDVLVDDANGNIYVAGSFTGEIDFDPDETNEEIKISNGDMDAFLISFDSDGAFRFVHTWGSPGPDEALGAALFDTSVYVTGYYGATTDFDPGDGEDIHLSNGVYDAFLSSFSTVSPWEYNWVGTWGADIADIGWDVAAAPWASGAVICASGEFMGDVDFNPDPIGQEIHSCSTYSDSYITLFDDNGNHLWAKTWGADNSPDTARGVTMDGSEIYVTGKWGGTAIFDPESSDPADEVTAAGSDDIYLSKFDVLGIYYWTRTWGAANTDHGFGVTLDPTNGDVIITGGFRGIIDFDPGPGTDELIAQSEDVFIVRLDSDGLYVWARSVGGTNVDTGFDVAVASTGVCYTTGYFQDTVDFNPGPGVDNHISVGNTDVFLLKLMQNGYWQ